jgi:hypothetical protein
LLACLVGTVLAPAAIGVANQFTGGHAPGADLELARTGLVLALRLTRLFRCLCLGFS